MDLLCLLWLITLSHLCSVLTAIGFHSRWSHLGCRWISSTYRAGSCYSAMDVDVAHIYSFIRKSLIAVSRVTLMSTKGVRLVNLAITRFATVPAVQTVVAGWRSSKQSAPIICALCRDSVPGATDRVTSQINVVRPA